MSLLNLLALAVDHYIVVCTPMDTFLQRSTRIKIVIVTLWVFLCKLQDFDNLHTRELSSSKCVESISGH